MHEDIGFLTAWGRGVNLVDIIEARETANHAAAATFDEFGTRCGVRTLRRTCDVGGVKYGALGVSTWGHRNALLCPIYFVM